MKRTLTSEVKAQAGERVLVTGWLHSLRQLGGLNFLVIRDGWGLVQAIAEREEEIAPLIENKLSVESVITVEGLVVNETQAPGGAELHDLSIEIITPIKEAPPIPLNKRKISANISTLLDQAVVMNRHPTRRAIFSLAAGMLSSFRNTLTTQGFTEIQTPKIVAAATESGANAFKLDYFGRPAYSNSFDLLFRGTELVTGGQRLHLYADYIAALEKAQLPLAPFDSYLEAFKYGMPPHGGFAIGSERLLMQLIGTSNVRLTTAFLRDLNRLDP